MIFHKRYYETKTYLKSKQTDSSWFFQPGIVQKMLENTTQIFMQNPKTEVTKSPRPVSPGTWQSNPKQLHSSWEVNTSEFQFFDKRLQVGCSCQRRCLSSTLIRSWVSEGYQRDKRVDQAEWSLVKSILLRYFQPNSDSKRRRCVYDNPLEWWYGGMVIWPKLNVPCCIALNFRTNFARRQRRKTDDRSDGIECEWGWVMWKEIHDTCGKENYIIYWSEISVPFRRHLETVSCFSCFLSRKTWNINMQCWFFT